MMDNTLLHLNLRAAVVELVWGIYHPQLVWLLSLVFCLENFWVCLSVGFFVLLKWWLLSVDLVLTVALLLICHAELSEEILTLVWWNLASAELVLWILVLPTHPAVWSERFSAVMELLSDK